MSFRARIRVAAFALLLGMSAFLLAACGGSGKTTSDNTTPTGPLPPIAHRLLTSAELPPGFTKNGPPSVATGIPAWLNRTQTPSGRRRAETARLTRLGFVAAASQNLASAKGPGLSLVEQFRAPKGARSEFVSQVTTFKFSPGVKQFPVSGIPNAFGFSVASGGENVVFPDGSYYYVVGAAWPSTAANRAAVIASAQKLYQRVHG
jgi:hypothetical protein